MPTLRLARPGDASGADVTMAEAVAELAAKVAAARQVAMLLVWETADGTLEMCAMPGSLAVRRGLLLAAYDATFPECVPGGE